MRRIARTLAEIAFVLAIASSKANAAPYCISDWDWIGYDSIPVWVHQDLAEHMHHLNGTYWTDDEIRQEVEQVLTTLQEYIPAGYPVLEFAGFSSHNWDWVEGQWGIPGAILIAPWLGASNCATHPTGDMHDNAPGGGMIIHLKRSDGVPGGEDCNIPWEHTRINPFLDEVAAVRGLLNHELLHALGFGDIDGLYCDLPCSNWPGYSCSCLQGDEGYGEQYENCPYFDWRNTTEYYPGLQESYRHHRESGGDGMTWSTLTVPPGSVSFAAVSNANPAEYLGLIVRRASATLAPVLYKWSWSTLQWATVAQLGSIGLAGRPAVVVTANPSYMFAIYLSGENDNQVYKDITVKRFDGYGGVTTWVQTHVTVKAGISASFDPVNDVIWLAWRKSTADHHEVVVQKFSATGTFGPIYELNEYSSDVPSVTCGPSDLGTTNCLVSWANAPLVYPPRYRYLRWRHFGLRCGKIGCTMSWGSTLEHPYIMFGPPSVSYKGPSNTNCAFLFAWSNPGPWVYTRCKAGSASAGLTAGTEVAHEIGGRLGMSPSLGANYGAGELINVWKP